LAEAIFVFTTEAQAQAQGSRLVSDVMEISV